VGEKPFMMTDHYPLFRASRSDKSFTWRAFSVYDPTTKRPQYEPEELCA
jgi:hypothetical protein